MQACTKIVIIIESKPATAMDGGRFGLLPSRGISPSMEGRSAEREAVPTGTNAGAVFPPQK